ncbi:MAG TPA: biopolymer transporter ExbD, partial [Polyangiales bacterium]
HTDADPKGKTDPFTLSLTSDGRMFFEQDPLDEQDFKQRLTSALEREPTRRLILRADRTAHSGVVRKLFKTCQEIGFPGISLRVNEKKSDEHAAR